MDCPPELRPGAGRHRAAVITGYVVAAWMAAGTPARAEDLAGDLLAAASVDHDPAERRRACSAFESTRLTPGRTRNDREAPSGYHAFVVTGQDRAFFPNEHPYGSSTAPTTDEEYDDPADTIAPGSGRQGTCASRSSPTASSSTRT